MIELGSADCVPDSAVLHSAGGFTWFYVDLVDDHGNGATVIWSWGLPFLPGYAGAARAGHPELPIDRPSVNVVVYRAGRERFYLLSEISRDDCQWSPDGRSWRLGESTFAWSDTTGPPGAAPTRTLNADIDLALPTGGRATGRLWLSGTLRRDAPGGPGRQDAGISDSTHLWTPMLAAARGGLDLQTPAGRLRVEGRGYHDRNSAPRPLHDLGIRSWWWGRVAFPDRDLIFYQLISRDPRSAPRDLVLELDADGTCRASVDPALRVSRLRRSTWGLRWPAIVSFRDPDGRTVQAEVMSLLDNGPFYQRYLLRGRCGEELGHGLGENVVPDRIDTDLLRPLVRMRVHRADGPNSMWLPLFSGDSEGRWARLLGRTGQVRA